MLHDGLRIQHLQQGLAEQKTKLLGRESNFIEQYSLHNSSSARRTTSTLQLLPAYGWNYLPLLGLQCWFDYDYPRQANG